MKSASRLIAKQRTLCDLIVTWLCVRNEDELTHRSPWIEVKLARNVNSTAKKKVHGTFNSLGEKIKMIVKSVGRVAKVHRWYPRDRIQMYKNVDKNRFECLRVWWGGTYNFGGWRTAKQQILLLTILQRCSQWYVYCLGVVNWIWILCHCDYSRCIGVSVLSDRKMSDFFKPVSAFR